MPTSASKSAACHPLPSKKHVPSKVISIYTITIMSSYNVSSFDSYNNRVLQGIYGDLETKRKYLLSYSKKLENERDDDMISIGNCWAQMPEAEKRSLEGEKYLVLWNSKKASYSQAIARNNANIGSLMIEYHQVKELMKQRRLICS